MVATRSSNVGVRAIGTSPPGKRVSVTRVLPDRVLGRPSAGAPERALRGGQDVQRVAYSTDRLRHSGGARTQQDPFWSQLDLISPDAGQGLDAIADHGGTREPQQHAIATA